MPKIINESNWWQASFHDHPGKEVKDPSAFISGKPKKYCMACMSVHIANIQADHDQAVSQGRSPSISRDEAVIRAHCELNLRF